jgi:MFS superfamily sulfate permease-like transporter
MKNFFTRWQDDLPASVVVFFVAVPLCLGIALASGAPLFSGLIAGIIGGIVVGSISHSSLGVSGPAAGLAIIVLHAIQDLGTFEIFLVAVIIGGVIQVLLGLLKGGVIGFYFPSSVIKGMLAAIGIIIFIKQIPHAFGYDRDYEGDMSFQQGDGQNTFSELSNMLDFISPSSIVVAAVSLFILLLWDLFLIKKSKVFKIIPGPLVAVVFGIVYQLICSKYLPDMSIKGGHLVTVPTSANLNEFFSNFTTPDFSAINNINVWLTGATIAVVASLETLLCVDATDKLDPEKGTTNTNRELLAQGTGNILSGLIGGLPITQVIVRSSANIQSGGKTKMAAIMHGFFILVCVSIIPFVLNLIPLAVLASILFVVGYKLANRAYLDRCINWGGNNSFHF